MGSWGQQGAAGQGLPGPSCSLGPARSPGSQWQPPVRFHGSGKINVDEAAREGEETLVASGLMSPPSSPRLARGDVTHHLPCQACGRLGTGPKARIIPGAPAAGRIIPESPAPLTLIRPLPPTWADPAQPRGAARGSE